MLRAEDLMIGDWIQYNDPYKGRKHRMKDECEWTALCNTMLPDKANEQM